RDAADGWKRALAARPEAQPLGLIARHAHAGRTGAREYLALARDLVLDLFGRAVGFAQQDGGGVEVVARAHELLDRVRCRTIHHFEPRRDDPGGDHVGYRPSRLLHVVERGHHHLRALRLGEELHRDLGDYDQHAFGADGERKQVVAWRVRRLRAELDRLARRGEPAQAEHVVHREAVFQAVHAARILGHVAADGARDLARGVWRIVKAEG